MVFIRAKYHSIDEETETSPLSILLFLVAGESRFVRHPWEQPERAIQGRLGSSYEILVRHG